MDEDQVKEGGEKNQGLSGVMNLLLMLSKS